MASRSRQTSQGATGGSSSQRRDSRELASQYVAGKKFKAKFIGSEEIPDFRAGHTAASAVIKKLRQEKARTKAGKTKCTISVQFKALTVVDDKSKPPILNVPIQKVKFVCHDHHDITVFAVIVQQDLPGDTTCYKLFCFQAEQKVAVLFVRSMNELFQLIHKMMKAKRQASRSQSTEEAAQSAQKEESVPTQPEEVTERTRFTVGESVEMSESSEFGIPPPPPSYKAAISKTNSDIFKVPDNMDITPVTIAPPPKSASSGKIRSQQQIQPAPTPIPRPQTTPTLPALQSPPASSLQTISESSAPRPRPRRQLSSGQPSSLAQVSSQLAASQPVAGNQERPLPPPSAGQNAQLASSQPRVSSQERPLPLPPTGIASVQSTAPSQERPLPPPPTARRSSRSRVVSAQPTAANQERPLPPIPPQPTSVEAPDRSNSGQNVWDEWRSLEGELQTLAQEVGIDVSSDSPAVMNSTEGVSFSFGNDPFNGSNSPAVVNSTEGAAFSFDDDPFNDDFFQSSFSSSEAVTAPPTSLPSQEPLAASEFFATFPDIPPLQIAAADPFSSPAAATQSTPSSHPAATTQPSDIRQSSVSFEANFFEPQSTNAVTTPTATGTQSTAPSSHPQSTTEDSGTDPFAAISTARVSSPVVSTTPTSDPFTDHTVTTPTTAAVGTTLEDNNVFGSDFASFSTPDAAPLQSNSFSFDSEFSEPQLQESNAATSTPTPLPTTSSFEANAFESQNVATTSASSSQSEIFKDGFSELQGNNVATTSVASSQPSVAAFSFDSNFSEPQTAVSASAPPSQEPSTNSFEPNFFEPRNTTSVTTQPSDVSQSSVSFEANFFEPQTTGTSQTASQAPKSSFSFEADFDSNPRSTATTSALPKGPLVSAPPSKERQANTSTQGRSRPKPKNTFGAKNFPKLNTSLEASANSNTSAPFSPETTSNSFNSSNFSIDNESTLQLTNPLYQSQTTNSSFQAEPLPAASVHAPFATGGTSNPHSSSQDWGGTVFPPQQVNFQDGSAAQPGVPQFASFPAAPVQQQPVAGYQGNVVQQFPVQNQAIAMMPPTAQVYNPAIPPVPVQNPLMVPTPEPAVMHNNYQSPMGSAGMFSPPQGLGGNVVDYGYNPFAGDFTSPPFAVHSSTPQSPGHASTQPQPQPSASPRPPIVIDGPDPFAELLPLALSPKKEDPKISEPPAPATIASIETPKTTQPKEPKRPSLNELYNQKHISGMLKPTNMAEQNKPSRVEEQNNGDPFTGGTSAGSTVQQSFEADFGGANSSSSWVAF